MMEYIIFNNYSKNNNRLVLAYTYYIGKIISTNFISILLSIFYLTFLSNTMINYFNNFSLLRGEREC